jgi:nucleoside-diphosphate-sugar epimerase
MGKNAAMRIVVSGAAGFLGSHLCRALLGRGDEVIGLDNLVTGRMQNLADVHDHQRFDFRHHDVSTFVDVDGTVDAVMHLASPASPTDFSRIPVAIMKSNSLGTHNLLGLARARDAKFFLASTSEVYGDPLVHPQPESYWGNVNPNGPRSMYDESKRFAEALAFAYRMEHGIDIRIVRIFNTYGPFMRPDDGRVVSTFVVQALKGEPVTVYGDGSHTRSLTYVDDQIRGFLKLLDGEHSGPMNIGNPVEITVRELAELVITMTGSTSKIVSLPVAVDDPKRRRPDITRAMEMLDWKPEIDLRTGLEKTIEYFRPELDGSS